MKTFMTLSDGTGSGRRLYTLEFNGITDLSPKYTLFEPLGEFTFTLQSTIPTVAYHINLFVAKYRRAIARQQVFDTGQIICGDWKVEMQFVTLWPMRSNEICALDVSALIQDTTFYYQEKLWNSGNIAATLANRMLISRSGIMY